MTAGLTTLGLPCRAVSVRDRCVQVRGGGPAVDRPARHRSAACPALGAALSHTRLTGRERQGRIGGPDPDYLPDADLRRRTTRTRQDNSYRSTDQKVRG